MITSLADLNDVINIAANHIVQKVCTETKDGCFDLSLEDIDYSRLKRNLTEDDLHQYADFLLGELAGRPEFESFDFNDLNIHGECKREYCPNLEDRWPEEPVMSVTQPLSMTELSEIGETAISALRNASLSGLRDTLGMNFSQAHRLGLTHQQHFFSIESPNMERPFWSEDVESILHHMKKQCEIGNQPTLYYNKIDPLNRITRVPLAEASNGRLISTPTPMQNQPNELEYIEAAKKVEGAVYNLPWGYSLSYRISGPNMVDRIPLTLQDALNQFADCTQHSSSPVLSAHMNAPSGTLRSEAVILKHNFRGTRMNAHTAPDNSFQPRRGSFYSDLACMAFPDRVLDIDRWRIRVVAPGEHYGRGNHLINEDSKPLVEFRDMDGASSHAPDGILVSSCSLDALLGDEQGRGGIQPGQGLNLYDSVESWTLSASEMAPVLSWLRQKEAQLFQQRETNRLDHKIHQAQNRVQPAQSERQPEKHLDLL